MRGVIGSTGPMMPMTGYFNSRREARRWAEGNLAHWNGYFTLRGKGEVAFDGETVQTRPGELLLLAPGHPRRYRIPEPRMGWEFYWLHFRATPRLTGHLPWFDPHGAGSGTRWPTCPACHLGDAAGGGAPVQPDRARPARPRAHRRGPAGSLLLRVAAAQARPEGAREMDPRIEQVLEQFHCELAAPFNIDRLAAHAGLSRSQFCLLFRRGTGLAPGFTWRRGAWRWRHTTCAPPLSPSPTWPRWWVCQPFYFTNRFRRRFGRSPSDYRVYPQGAR